MTWYLEKNNILVEEQAGFRRGRCTEDQITLIAQDIEDGFQEKRHTVVVWIDMAKAFDCVWRDGLLFKLKDNGISGNMFKWTEQYLQNRKARVRTQHFKSRTQNMKHGVPQDGILSPTLFSMFMNDIQTILPKGVYGAMYADDMAIWATEEYTGTAQARLQLALKALRMWTEKWLMKINPEKTTFTTFTLSTKPQTVHLKIGKHQLREEPSPTYLGVTFDKRLTWKAQTDKCQERGILRT
ncbi:RNA-directed DNA polymerase from [Elysia marginata]|uniref:RNA-directed DNA polymerase from n=1 Tax=Elysia marginata TaxID=1093978 RepID=A0AAV4IUF9_9GAST|nr:RNA-directed DNA polymerase from [Elysia marginata]